jgi:phosphatidylserine/phosphatidylglycerophosphate/cardiolipin synthase-like enzyme
MIVTGHRSESREDRQFYHPAVDVYFSPHGGCTEAILDEINGAQHCILVQAYSFTSDAIGAALVQCHARGVRVEVIMDRSQSSARGSELTKLKAAHIPVYIDRVHKIAHNKILIIDWETVITGSFNFTANAEDDNTENLLVLHDKAPAERYLSNWATEKLVSN